jgi:hypothetical protein
MNFLKKAPICFVPIAQTAPLISKHRQDLPPTTEREERLREEKGSLIKKKIKFSSYVRKFRMEQLQSQYMTNGLLICG